MIKILLILFLPFYLNCLAVQKIDSKQSENIIFQAKDKEILEQIFDATKDDKNTPISELMIKVGVFFKETPYTAATLEINPKNEKLVINLREMDCTTFAENILAISRTIKSETPSFEKFTNELQNIRYRDGKINGYTSRIHYFSDWIFENDRREFVKNISGEIANIPYPLKVNFMSTHPGSYKQLSDSTLIPLISGQEKEISARKMFYIPEERIAEFENQLWDGDIAGITTGIKGMDISHVVILLRKEGRIHILHASQTGMKVLISEETLEDYLKNSKSATGIMVARPL